MSERAPALRTLAKEAGIQVSWRTADGDRRDVTDETMLALLPRLGVGITRKSEAADALARLRAGAADALVPPVSVLWDGTPLRLPLRLRDPVLAAHFELTIDLDPAVGGDQLRWSRKESRVGMTRRLPDGTFAVTIDAPGRIPAGVHRLRLQLGGRSASGTVIAAPGRLPETAISDRRRWGLFAPVYALHDDHEPLGGDLGTFERLASWAGDLGARVFATLPLLAAFHGAGAEPNESSPYSPVSRRFWNEAYLDLNALPEAGPPAPVPAFDGAAIDPRLLAAARRVRLTAAMDRLASEPQREQQWHEWLDARPDVVEYAAFRAAVERDGPGATAARPDLDDPIARYHAFAQWSMDRALRELAERFAQRRQTMCLDLPIGAHPHGYDRYAHRDLFVDGATIGAPPDRFFAGGQDWGFAPVDPNAARRSGHRHFVDCVEHHLSVAPVLRIDHVMGLQRLWWIPEGASPGDGAYVRYPADELYAALCAVADRHHGLLVGENLGTVPSETDRAMQRHRLLATWVAQFEVGEHFEMPSRHVLACLDTHDTATFASFWHDLAPPARGALLGALRGAGLLDGRGDGEVDDGGEGDRDGDTLDGDLLEPAEVLDAMLHFIGSSRAEIVIASIEDLWLEIEAQNVPGTSAHQRPNFRRRAACSLGELRNLKRARETLRELDRARKGSPE